MEALRSWYKIHIVPVLPCLRMDRRGMTYGILVLALVILSLDVTQMVWQVSGIREQEAADGYTVHLICRNITEEQAEGLRSSAKNFRKYRDGAFEIVSVTPLERSYDTRYDAEILLVPQLKEFYKSSLIVCYTSFMQNYQAYLTASPGAWIETTPLYYAQAEYTFSTFVYFMLDLLSLRGSGDTVTTILETEAPYLVKPLFGLGTELVSETTVHFVRSLAGILCGGILAIFLMIWLETEHMRYDFAIFSVFGADTGRLTVFLLYKMLLSGLCVQIPCAVLTYVLGLCFYGLDALFISPGIYLFSLLTTVVLVPAVVRLMTHMRGRQSLITQLSADDNRIWLISPRRSRLRRDPEKLVFRYAVLNICRYGKFFAFFLAAVLGFSVLLSCTGFLVSPPEEMPQYTVSFPTVMEYSVYETRFVPEVQSIGGLIPKGQLSVSGQDSGILLEENGNIHTEWTLAAAGEAFIAEYPEAEAWIADGKAVLCGSPAETVRIHKPMDVSVGERTERAEKEPVIPYRYETAEISVGMCLPGGENPVLYVPAELYRNLVGERSGAVLGRHIRLAESASLSDAVYYKSGQYLQAFRLRCVDFIPEDTPYAGEYMDVLMDPASVAVRCSPEIWEALAWQYGDRVELSDTGRKRLYAAESEIYLTPDKQLENLLFQYEYYRIAAVYLTEDAPLEILTGSALYEQITGLKMGYTEAAIALEDPDRTDTDAIWQDLREMAGKYYEVYIENTGAAEKMRLYHGYCRPAEAWIIRVCTFGASLLILAEMLTLFDTRRQNEYRMLFTYGGDRVLVRKLRWGCVVLAAACGAVLSAVVFVIL